jgi:hypothetical protein
LEDVSPEHSINPVRPGTWPSAASPDDIFAVEEVKEERRRVWWLLYIADRHLALCYNTPLKILDIECHSYQPSMKSFGRAFRANANIVNRKS